MNSRLMFSKASDEWETPRDLFDTLNAEFHFTLDAAASKANHLCRDWRGLDHPKAECRDGLTGDWAASTWLNPPYSMCREFVAKCAEEQRKGHTVVCLVPSRTDTRWWHDYVWDREHHRPRPGVEVRFLKGRLKFGGMGVTNSAPFPSVVLVFRPI